jgi:molybdopterin/thiamine biosynthesis adenylyltransferase
MAVAHSRLGGAGSSTTGGEAMLDKFNYERFISRNAGYVPAELQRRIRTSRLLIAGCGIGSTIAEACLRLGFEHLILIDMDHVEEHNLNRQDFIAADIGTAKVDALARRLLSINPSASIRAINEWVTPENAADFVSQADIVLDTIDFLSLAGIIALHDAGHAQKKPIVSAFSVGWGAAAIYFPPEPECTFRAIFGLPAVGSVEDISYVERFMHLVERLQGDLAEDVVTGLKRTLTIMDDGRPCPAPHVSAGSWAVGSLAATIAARILSAEPITPAPRMILLNMSNVCTMQGIDLL